MNYQTRKAIESWLPAALLELKRGGDPATSAGMAELVTAKLTPSELENAASSAVDGYIGDLLARLPSELAGLSPESIRELVDAVAYNSDVSCTE